MSCYFHFLLLSFTSFHSHYDCNVLYINEETKQKKNREEKTFSFIFLFQFHKFASSFSLLSFFFSNVLLFLFLEKWFRLLEKYTRCILQKAVDKLNNMNMKKRCRRKCEKEGISYTHFAQQTHEHFSFILE